MQTYAGNEGHGKFQQSEVLAAIFSAGALDILRTDVPGVLDILRVFLVF